MTKIPSETRDLLEKAIYYPMVLKVLEKDLNIINQSALKLPNPYINWINKTMDAVHKDLYVVKRDMKKQGVKIQEVKRDDTFTTYLFLFRGYEEYHNYFNPVIKTKVEELLAYYLFERFHSRLREN